MWGLKAFQVFVWARGDREREARSISGPEKFKPYFFYSYYFFFYETSVTLYAYGYFWHLTYKVNLRSLMARFSKLVHNLKRAYGRVKQKEIWAWRRHVVCVYGLFWHWICQCCFGSIQCTFVKLSHTLKMNYRTAKRAKLWTSSWYALYGYG